MDISGTILKILNDAEANILGELAKAVRDGDLNSVEAVRPVIEELRQVKKRLTGGHSELAVSANNGSTSQSSSKSNGKARLRRIKSSGSKYPRFEIRNETLYRIAWSRKQKSEYEHKVPKGSVIEIAQAMDSLTEADQRPVAVDKIVGKVGRSTSVQIPQYQIYLVVGWLRQLGAIEQIGRDGYRIPSGMSRTVLKNWDRAAI